MKCEEYFFLYWREHRQSHIEFRDNESWNSGCWRLKCGEILLYLWNFLRLRGILLLLTYAVNHTLKCFILRWHEFRLQFHFFLQRLFSRVTISAIQFKHKKQIICEFNEFIRLANLIRVLRVIYLNIWILKILLSNILTNNLQYN